MPLTMCQMPHRLAITTIPRSELNCTAMMPSASPAFCMPPSMTTARVSAVRDPVMRSVPAWRCNQAA